MKLEYTYLNPCFNQNMLIVNESCEPIHHRINEKSGTNSEEMP
jgi:hypothetical protein